ncbi:hypothetical protein [Curtobacterium flaccumfaciens]|uniref:hypothetical protein n=1 Tax=Curtobacterium flaccumfaciens TaxID=2035 RepID=UPI001ADA1BAB|nr:hypothetical protein [Curtobacterium flaccumfaciens]MBO9041407.1 hypothetical protein [Curtobacterium flaccumfaciens pv. flaccumfaciens]
MEHQLQTVERPGRSSVLTILVACTALGASMATAPDRALWDPGSVLLFGGAVCAAMYWLGQGGRRGASRTRVAASEWVALSSGLGVGLLLGLLLLEGSGAFAALFPVPLVAIDAAVSRSDGNVRQRSTVLGTAAALVVAILVTGDDLQRGFADLVQGAVVAGVLSTLALVLRSAVRRQRA